MLCNEATEQMRSAIRDTLERTAKGAVANTIQNCVIIFENDPVFAGKIRRNLLTASEDITGPMPWKRGGVRYDDQDRPHVLYYFEQHYGIHSEKSIDNALKVVASRHSHHPIQTYLNGLVWDGTPRLRFALHRFLGADVSDYSENCLKVFMLGAAERVFSPGCKFDLMPVLTGSQGVGKSSFLRLLAVKDEWFTDDLHRLDDEKVYQKMAGYWIIEMPEMVATANTKSIEEIKSFLSRCKDNYRFPYDRYASDHPRQCVFSGTTNRMDLLPMDRSGNRRFLPIQIHARSAEVHILEDEAASRAYIDQLWAQIMALRASGCTIAQLSSSISKQLPQEQERFMQEDVQAGPIYGYMNTTGETRVCTMQLYREALGHTVETPRKWELRDIRDIVCQGIENGTLQGWQPFTSSRRFEKYGTQRGWERSPDEAEAADFVNQPIPQPVNQPEQMTFTVVDTPADIPFA